jgi:hypothetical protein
MDRQYLARLRDLDGSGEGRTCKECGEPAKFDPEGNVWVCLDPECIVNDPPEDELFD